MFYKQILPKKFSCILTIMVLLYSCSPVKYYNSRLNTLLSENQLKSDVDHVYNKLQKLHPNLYWYISKKDLDLKFDSVKKSITKPMNNRDFYKALSPVIASIGQGHTFMYPPTKMLKTKEEISSHEFGKTPFTKFEFETFNNKLYIVKNNSKDTSIAIGTEVISVNHSNPVELVTKYKNNFASDGFNKTFKTNKLSKGFSSFFYFENDITDSIQCELKFNDSIRTVCLKRRPSFDSTKKKKPVTISSVEKAKKIKETKKNKYLGYNKNTKKYSKNLSFYEPDSSIAVIKLNDFTQGKSKKFFDDCFKQLSKLKTKNLVIDLRDNPGGRIKEINDLYSYLVDSDYYFLDKAMVASKTSILHMGYFNGIPPGTIIARAVFYPLYFGIMTVPFLKVHKQADKKYYYSISESKLQHAKPNNFKGKIYVLINGGSFSASCIISSNLKGSKRAIFVGCETGGAYNGTVAGYMPVYTLPHSKIKIRFGLAVIQPHYKTNMEGHGIFPDVEIIPTLQDHIKGVDPELNWVLEDAKNKK